MSEQINSDPNMIRRLCEITERSLGESLDPSAPVLGATDVIIANNLSEALSRPDSLTFVHEIDNVPIGFCWFIPIGTMDPERTTGDNTAYCYIAAVDPDYQGQGVIWEILNSSYQALHEIHGYDYLELDAKLSTGFALKLASHFGFSDKSQGSVVELYEHEKYPEFGRQMFFRINLVEQIRRQGG